MKTIILAAGYARRLYPLTINQPKPLLPLGGKPILFRLLDKIKDSAISMDMVYVITNSRFYAHFKESLTAVQYPFPVTLVDDHTQTETDKLGAIKDITYCISKMSIDDDLLIVAGDNIFEDQLGTMFTVCRGKDRVLGVYDIGSKKNAMRYGVIETDKDGRVLSFEEKPKNPKSSLIAMCVYYFSRNVLGEIKQFVQSSQNVDAPGYFLQWLVSQGKPLFTHTFHEKWFDIGDINSLRKADEYYRKQERVNRAKLIEEEVTV